MVEKPKIIGTLTTPEHSYTIMRALGEGTTSKVYLCKR
jgi:BR serine/threonine kinase